MTDKAPEELLNNLRGLKPRLSHGGVYGAHHIDAAITTIESLTTQVAEMKAENAQLRTNFDRRVKELAQMMLRAERSERAVISND